MCRRRERVLQLHHAGHRLGICMRLRLTYLGSLLQTLDAMLRPSKPVAALEGTVTRLLRGSLCSGSHSRSQLRIRHAGSQNQRRPAVVGVSLLTLKAEGPILRKGQYRCGGRCDEGARSGRRSMAVECCCWLASRESGGFSRHTGAILD